MAELLASFATHTFTPEELERYIVEGSAEVGKFLPSDTVSLVKSANIGKKSFSIKLKGIKVGVSALRPKVALFLCVLKCAEISDQIGYAGCKADVSELCDTIRANWERKDEKKGEEVAA